MDGYVWVNRNVEVIDRDHPDYDHYRELEEVEQLIAAGEAYVEGKPAASGCC